MRSTTLRSLRGTLSHRVCDHNDKSLVMMLSSQTCIIVIGGMYYLRRINEQNIYYFFLSIALRPFVDRCAI